MTVTEDQKAAARKAGAQHARRVVEECFPDHAAIAAAHLAPFRTMTYKQLAEHVGTDVATFAQFLAPPYMEAYVKGVEHQFYVMSMRLHGLQIHTTEVPLT